MQLLTAGIVLAMLITFQGVGSVRATPGGGTQGALDIGAAESIRRYNVVWTSPSKDASGVMPIGNGDRASGVYAISDGDPCLLMAKNDAFNHSGEIYKSGRVRPNVIPLPEGYPAPYIALMMDRLNSPGMTGGNWTYGAMYLYHGCLR